MVANGLLGHGRSEDELKAEGEIQSIIYVVVENELTDLLSQH